MSGKVLANVKNEKIVGTFLIAPFGKLSYFGGKVLSLLSHRQIKKFYKIMAVSQPAVDFAKELYKQDIETLGICYDFHKYNIKVSRDSSVVEILFLGRLVKRKGCLTLLKSLVILNNSYPSLTYHVTIAGAGPMSASLTKYSLEHNLSDKVSFIGFVSETIKIKLLANSDISVFPSLSGESFGIVLLEAMSTGRSLVIAAANPGYAQTLSRVADEVLFTPGDELQLANLLLRYIQDPLERQAIAIKQQEIASSYDQNIVGQKLLDIYNAAVNPN